MATPVKSIEELFLKIFKVTVLVVMALALLAIVVLVAIAMYQNSQSPKEPAPAQKAVVKEIGLEDLKRFLIEKEKRDSAGSDATKQPLSGRPISLQFQEDATALFRCASVFGKQVGVAFEDTNDAVNAQRLQEIRTYVERSAFASPLRGEPWVKAVATFTCMALADSSIIALRTEGKVKTIFFPVMAFHVEAWDANQSAKMKFDLGEESRVAAERSAEALRIATAKALAVTCLIGAASAFALFMMLALYLLAAKIENDLRDINESIRATGVPRVGEGSDDARHTDARMVNQAPIAAP